MGGPDGNLERHSADQLPLGSVTNLNRGGGTSGNHVYIDVGTVQDITHGSTLTDVHSAGGWIKIAVCHALSIGV